MPGDAALRGDPAGSAGLLRRAPRTPGDGSKPPLTRLDASGHIPVEGEVRLADPGATSGMFVIKGATAMKAARRYGRWFGLCLVLFLWAMPGRSAAQEICGEVRTELIAGRNIVAGVVDISHDEAALYITLSTDGWAILRSQVHVAATPEETPQSRWGNIPESPSVRLRPCARIARGDRRLHHRARRARSLPGRGRVSRSDPRPLRPRPAHADLRGAAISPISMGGGHLLLTLGTADVRRVRPPVLCNVSTRHPGRSHVA